MEGFAKAWLVGSCDLVDLVEVYERVCGVLAEPIACVEFGEMIGYRLAHIACGGMCGEVDSEEWDVDDFCEGINEGGLSASCRAGHEDVRLGLVCCVREAMADVLIGACELAFGIFLSYDRGIEEVYDHSGTVTFFWCEGVLLVVCSGMIHGSREVMVSFEDSYIGYESKQLYAGFCLVIVWYGHGSFGMRMILFGLSRSCSCSARSSCSCSGQMSSRPLV